MKYVILTDANEQLWRPNPDIHPDAGYLLYRTDDGHWAWLYQEPNEEDEFGPRFDHRDEALHGIADNWDETGGTESAQFMRVVRAQANRGQFERERALVTA